MSSADFETDIDKLMEGRPDSSPAVMKGTTGGQQLQPDEPHHHLDATAANAQATEYYKFYSRHGTERRNPRLPRPPVATAFSADQNPSDKAIDAAVAVAASPANQSPKGARLGAHFKTESSTIQRPPQVEEFVKRTTEKKPMAPSDLISAEDEALLAEKHKNKASVDVPEQQCYRSAGSESKWWRDSDNIVGSILSCFDLKEKVVVNDEPRTAAALLGSVCKKWHSSVTALSPPVSASVQDAALETAKTSTRVGGSATLPRPTSGGAFSGRLQRIMDINARKIQTVFRRFRAVSAAQRTLALVHIVRHELQCPRLPNIVESKQTSPEGFLYEMSIEYEYQLQVANMANRLVHEAKKKQLKMERRKQRRRDAGLPSSSDDEERDSDDESFASSTSSSIEFRGEDDDDGPRLPKNWTRRGLLTQAEVEECYANVEANYSEGYCNFPSSSPLPILRTFLDGTNNYNTYTACLHALVSEAHVATNSNKSSKHVSFANDVMVPKNGKLGLFVTHPDWFQRSFMQSILDKENTIMPLVKKSKSPTPPSSTGSGPSSTTNPRSVGATSSSSSTSPTKKDISVSNLIPHDHMPSSVQLVRDELKQVERFNAEEELVYAAENAPTEWFGKNVTKESLTVAAADVAGGHDHQHLSLSEAPVPTAAQLEAAAEKRHKQEELDAEFKWPEKLDPAFRELSELDMEDDPELKFYDSDDEQVVEELDDDSEDDGVIATQTDSPPAATTRRAKAFKTEEEHLREMELEEKRRREEISRRLEQIYGSGESYDTSSSKRIGGGGSSVAHKSSSASNATERITPSNAEEDDIVAICSSLKGGKKQSSQKGSGSGADVPKPSVCMICELDGEGLRLCLCSATWLHEDCAMGVAADGGLKCCSSCAAP